MPHSGPRRGPLPLAVTFWGEALRILQPEVVEDSIWLTMQIPAISFCSWGCRCEELIAVEFVGLQNLLNLGVSVEKLNLETESPDQQSDAVRKSLQRKRCVIWFDQGSAGIVRKAIDSDRFETMRWSASGRRSEGIGAIYASPHTRLYGLRANRRIIAKGADRWHALFNSAAVAMRPPAIGLCARKRIPTVRGCGAGAVSALSSSISQFRSTPYLRRTLARWRMGFSASESILIRAARSSRRRPENLLRQAAALCSRAKSELDEINVDLREFEIANSRDSIAGQELREGSTRISACANDVSLLVVEAALAALGAGESLRGALIEEGSSGGRALDELLYLSRSGGPRFRQLAARRLGDVPDRRAVTALGQLLYERDSAISDSALNSVALLPAGDLLPVLRGIYPHLPEVREGSPVSLRAGILALVAASAPGLEPTDLLRHALTAKRDGESESLRAIAAWLLYDHFGAEAAEVFRQVLEVGRPAARRLARMYLAKIEA